MVSVLNDFEQKPNFLYTMTPNLLSTSRLQHYKSKVKDKSSWNKRFNELLQFKQSEGHCRVPTKYPSNPRLASWVSSQRKHYSYMMRGKQSSMTSERIRRLEDIEFVWKVPRSGGVKPDDLRWKKYYEELNFFKKLHGHCRVPQRYLANPKLGVWVHMQRVNYKYRSEGDMRSSMNEDRIQSLEQIGFIWQEDNAKFKPDDEAWLEKYEELKKFKRLFGHCRVPRGYQENPSLGNWVSSQRMHFKKFKEGKKSCMTTFRLKLLEDIGLLRKRGPFKDVLQTSQSCKPADGVSIISDIEIALILVELKGYIHPN